MTSPDDRPRTDTSALRGYADTVSRAFEFALTTAIFAGAGLLLDRWLGTSPVFVIVLALLGIVGQFVRMWFAYDAEMRRHEAALPSAMSGAAPTVAAVLRADHGRPPVPSVTANVVALFRRRRKVTS